MQNVKEELTTKTILFYAAYFVKCMHVCK